MVLGPQLGKRSFDESLKRVSGDVRNQQLLVVFATFMAILPQVRMEQASHCRWTKDENVSFAHVQPPLL